VLFTGKEQENAEKLMTPIFYIFRPMAIVFIVFNKEITREQNDRISRLVSV
jgi:hypothetical protein